MRAIVTTYHGPTDYRGSRIIARAPDGSRRGPSVTVPYEHEWPEGAPAHATAALTLAVRLGWLPDGSALAPGAIDDGRYAWVILPGAAGMTAWSAGVAYRPCDRDISA